MWKVLNNELVIRKEDCCSPIMKQLKTKILLLKLIFLLFFYVVHSLNLLKPIVKGVRLNLKISLDIKRCSLCKFKLTNINAIKNLFL